MSNLNQVIQLFSKYAANEELPNAMIKRVIGRVRNNELDQLNDTDKYYLWDSIAANDLGIVYDPNTKALYNWLTTVINKSNDSDNAISATQIAKHLIEQSYEVEIDDETNVQSDGVI